MFRFLLFSISLLLISAQAIAETLKKEAELQPFAERVMKEVARGNMEKAFEVMEPLSILPDAEFQSAALGSRSARDKAGPRYGKTVGYEFIGSEKIGESLVLITFIERTEKHALPWFFYFYKSPSGWVLNSFAWHDQMPLLFN